MVFNAILNNISAISWRSVLVVEETEYPEKTTNLLQVPDKLYRNNAVSSTPLLSGIQTHNGSDDRH